MRIEDIRTAEEIAYQTNELIDEIEMITIMTSNLTIRFLSALQELVDLK